MRRSAATVLVLRVVLLVFASAAETQAAPRVPRFGMLCTHSCSDSTNDAFLDELRKLGWVEGSTIVIERKGAGGRFDQLPALAADLVRTKPDLLVAFAPQPVRAVKDATSEIPIVMLFVADPVGLGLASSLAHPGGNLTGVATLVPGGFGGKALGILRELLPQAKRVAAFINPSNDIHRLNFPREHLSPADKLGLQLDIIEVREAEEVPGAIATAKAGGAEASNTVEGYYSIFKRGMRGVYQHCKEKHLHRYLSEFDFRYSNRIARGVDDVARADRALKGIVGKRLTYRATPE
jgi:putative tryptophan/tyrosine transport system substrate-binding protein